MSEDVSHDLQYLRHLLSNLPNTVPCCNTSLYDFCNFEPDPQLVELYGTNKAAVNNVLKVTFAPQGWTDGPSAFLPLDQGPGLVAIVDVLCRSICEFLQSAILKKWLEDLVKVAIYEFETGGIIASWISNLSHLIVKMYE